MTQLLNVELERQVTAWKSMFETDISQVQIQLDSAVRRLVTEEDPELIATQLRKSKETAKIVGECK